MFKAGIRFAAFLLFCGVACAQTINPNQIRPATTNGFVLTTVDGATVWAVSPSTPTFQTNSVNNLSQTTLNLEAGTGMTITNTSGGNVLFQAANGTTLPPPFPVPNGQFVAWAYPTACVTGNPTTDTYGVAICGPQAGFVAQYASRPLGNCCWNDTWSGFVMPSLPSDAVIQGVYGVEFVQHLTQTGLPAALSAGSCSSHATNSPSPDINFTGEYFTTSLGSTTAAVTAATCTLGTDSSIGPASVFDANYINQVAVAIYYTTTHPPPLLPYAPIPINITLQTNGTTNANQGLLNLKAGTGMTLTDNGAGQITFASSAASGVTSINSTAGAYTFSFSAGAGSCSGTTCTFTGSGSGGGSVTNFVANTADWPAWLVPTVTSSTTTPTLLVAASAIPYTALTSLSANTVLGALTATTPSGLAVPDCHTVGTSALTWTAGGGFGCNTITGAVTVTSVSNSDGTLTISPTTGAVVASLALGHAQTWTALQGFNSGVNLVGTTSPFEVQGSAGTAGLCLTSAGAGATPTWGTCGGGGGGGISGLTLNFIPKAGSSTTLTANSALDDGVTTAATITSSEPIAITGATHGITIPAGTAVAGAAGKVIYASDATNGYGELNENNTGASRICTVLNALCGGGGGSTTDTRPTQTTTVKGITVNPSATYTFSTSPTSPSTAGTITHIHITLGTNNDDGMTIAQTGKIQITCDGQTETFPMGMFFAGMDAPTVFVSDWIAQTSGYPEQQFNSMDRRVEINYTTGCTLTFTNNSYIAIASLFADIQYRVGANVSRPSRQHWHAYYTPATTLAAFAPLTMLPTNSDTAGGELDSQYLFVASATDNFYDEFEPTVTTDGTIAVTANGTEDYYGCGYNCQNGKGGIQISKWGQLYASGNGTLPGASLQSPVTPFDSMFYRLFATTDGDNVLFTGNMTAAWANGLSPAPGPVNAQSLVTWWTHDAAAAPVTYSPIGGQILPATITLSTATAGATICYTTDGTLPIGNGAGGCTHGTSGTSVPLTTPATIIAIATKGGFADGKITSALYGTTASLGYITGSYAANGVNTTSVTSSSITFNAGDHAVILCRSNTDVNGGPILTNLPPLSVASNNTSSRVDLIRLGQSQNSTPAAATEVSYYVDQMPAGATTFTCTSTVAVDFMGVVVLDYAAGATHFFNARGDVVNTTTTAVTNAYSTGAAGLIVSCFDPQYGAGTLTAGSIGGSAATLRLPSSNNFGCEDRITGAAQTGITSSMSAVNSGVWGIGTITFQ